MIPANIALFVGLVAPLAAQVAPEIDGASSIADGHALVPRKRQFALFADPHELLPPAVPAGFVATGDVDGDGDIDALLGSAVAYASYHRPHLWKNLGDGRFVSASDALGVFPIPNGGPVALLDLDGDLDLDALSGGLVFWNDGQGNFTYDPTAISAPPMPTATVADLDGDGVVDSVSGSDSGDFDLDGDADHLVVSHYFESGFPETYSAVIELGDGQGGFLTSTDLTEEFPPPGLLGIGKRLIADMDGDGDPDAIVSGPEAYFYSLTRLRIFPNDGAGRFGEPLTLPFSHWSSAKALAAADVDGDDDMDLLCASSDSDGGGLELFRQEPVGVFTYGSAYGASDLTDFDVGDVDGDGDFDVLFTDYNNNPFTDRPLLLNDGAGNFAIDPTLSILYADPRDAVLHDVDGDGDLDVLIGSGIYLGVPSSFHRNDSPGWTDASGGLSFATANSIAPGDVDGDGDVDLLVAGDDEGQPYLNPELRLHRNDGNETFTAGPVIAAGYPPSAETVLADVDLDGDLDAFLLFGILETDEAARAFENDGNGNFAPARWPMPKLPHESSFADVDTDGDLDVLGGGLWSNLTRQVAWRTPAKLGRTHTLDLYGPPGAGWTLFGAQGTARIPTAFGIMLLDPATTYVAGSGTFDVRGHHAFALDVPLQPGLIGLSLHWQALFGTPLRLSNRDTTTITGY